MVLYYSSWTCKYWKKCVLLSAGGVSDMAQTIKIRRLRMSAVGLPGLIRLLRIVGDPVMVDLLAHYGSALASTRSQGFWCNER
jgi:hypothetical protein